MGGHRRLRDLNDTAARVWSCQCAWEPRAYGCPELHLAFPKAQQNAARHWWLASCCTKDASASKTKKYIPYLCVSIRLVALLELEAHRRPQACRGCRGERVVRPWGGMDRVETPHTGRARREHAVVVAAARLEVDSRRRTEGQAGGSDYGSYGGLVAVGMAVEQVDGRPWCSCGRWRICEAVGEYGGCGRPGRREQRRVLGRQCTTQRDVVTAQSEAEAEETECSTSSASKERPSARFRWLTTVPAHPCICSPARATPDSITTLDRATASAPTNTGRHRPAACEGSSSSPACWQIIAHQARRARRRGTQTRPPARSEDLLLPPPYLPLQRPKAVRQIGAAAAWSRLEAAPISLVGCILTCPRHVSRPTSAHTYASPSDAWRSRLDLGDLSRPFQICLRRRRASGVRRLLALRYARDMFQCSERGCHQRCYALREAPRGEVPAL
jgi:hypothetical protein